MTLAYKSPRYVLSSVKLLSEICSLLQGMEHMCVTLFNIRGRIHNASGKAVLTFSVSRKGSIVFYQDRTIRVKLPPRNLKKNKDSTVL